MGAIFFGHREFALLLFLVLASLLTDAAGPLPSSPLSAPLTPHSTVLLRRGRNVGEMSPGLTLNLNQALTTATDAAKSAWAAAKAVEALAKENEKFVPKIEAEIAVAKASAETAKEQDDAATVLLAETRVGVRAAALAAAQAYLVEVKQAGARLGKSVGGPGGAPSAAPSGAPGGPTGETQSAVEAAAVAAGQAAAEHHAALVRGREAILDYNGRESALTTAAEKLRLESAKLMDAATAQQALGRNDTAGRMIIRAQALWSQQDGMEREAEQVHETALNTSALFPAYRLAMRNMNDAAAKAAIPAATTEAPLPY